MAYANKSIASRIEWCRRQSTQTCAPLEIAGWRAEAEGLQDALLDSDHTTQYQQGPLGLFERYAMGLQDGEALIRATAVDYQFAPPTRTAGTGDESTRRIMGLTRHVETNVRECRVTGLDQK